MPPTVTGGGTTNGGEAAEKRPVATQRVAERKSDLICRIKYGNTLPDIPFDLKFVQYPFDTHRFVMYTPTSLERSYKYEVLTEHDLGVTIDLINRDLYQADPYAVLDPADEKLLEEDVHTPQDSVRSRQHSRSVSWLRKSEYISTEQTRFQPQNLENIEAKVGYNVKKSLREETLYLDREAQIKAIEKTFSDSKQEIKKHHSKPNVVPVEVLPVFPDFQNWKYPCAQVIFDSDPAPQGKNVPAQMEEMSQAMIRGVMDESGEQFVAYFLPTEETLQKRRVDNAAAVLYKDGEDYEYKIAREYNWNVKSKASKGYEENYFFVVKPDGVYYNELETRVRLNKRRVKAGQQSSNTKLVIKHRPLDANEHRMQRYREKQLEPVGEDDEEEELEMEDEDDDEQMPEATETANGVQDATEKSDNRETQNARDRAMHSRSRSKASSASSASRSRSRSGSRSSSASRSRSGSRSHSGSRSRSRSGSGSRSRSRSGSGSRSRSNSKSQSRSRSGSRAGSKTPRGSASPHSRSSSASGSAASRSRSGSRASSRATSRSRSRSRSQSGSPSGSRSRSVSKEKSRSRSYSRSKSRSQSGSRSRSRSGSRSGSSTAQSRSGSNSENESGSDAE